MSATSLVTSSGTMAGASIATVLAWLVPAGAAEELPSAIIGTWTQQEGGSASNPRFVTFDGTEVAIDGERCTLDVLRTLHAARWYADVACTSDRVWLDINLIDEGRMMINRRPLAEADFYVRRPPATPSQGGAK